MNGGRRQAGAGRGVRHGGGIAEAAARYGGRPAEWLDLSTGINPLPPALPAIPAAAWQRLPDADQVAAARQAAARFYGTGAGTQPLPVPGVQAAIQVLPQLVACGAGDGIGDGIGAGDGTGIAAGADAGRRRAAVLAPSYGEYAHILAGAGLAVDAVHDPFAAVGAADAGAFAVVVVVNPNNPDARRFARADLLALHARLAEGGGLLVIDEAFADLDPSESLAGEACRRDGLLVLRSFGKFFGLAGLRLGFAVAGEALLARISHALGPWAVSGPALAVGAALLGDDVAGAALRRRILARRDATRAVLEEAGLAIVGDGGLFLLAETDTAAGIAAALARRKILVRAFDEAPTWLRFGLTADAAEAGRLAAALQGSAATAVPGR